MAKKEEKVINFEREYPKLIKELEKKVDATDDSALLDMYQKELFALMGKKSQIEFFKFVNGDDTLIESYDSETWSIVGKDRSTNPLPVSIGYAPLIDEGAKREDFDALFDYTNLATFGGFDYYYLEDLNRLMDGKIQDQKRSVNMLINKAQLRKLQTTVDSMEEISFLSFVGDNGEDRYVIAQNDTPLFINLIPFTRNKQGRMELDGVLYRTTSKENEYNGLPYRKLDRKRRV